MKSAKTIVIMAIAIVGIIASISTISDTTGIEVFSTASAVEGNATTGQIQDTKLYIGLIAVGAGLAVGIAGLGAGIGEASIGAAAVGAMAEDPKTFGKGLLLTVIPETIVIFGFVIAALLWFTK